MNKKPFLILITTLLICALTITWICSMIMGVDVLTALVFLFGEAAMAITLTIAYGSWQDKPKNLVKNPKVDFPAFTPISTKKLQIQETKPIKSKNRKIGYGTKMWQIDSENEQRLIEFLIAADLLMDEEEYYSLEDLELAATLTMYDGPDQIPGVRMISAEPKISIDPVKEHEHPTSIDLNTPEPALDYSTDSSNHSGGYDGGGFDSSNF